jgi:carbon starvation protein CstA
MTTYLVNRRKGKYALTTALPMVVVGVTTISAGLLSIRDIFRPLTHNSATAVQGYLNSGMMALFVLGVTLIILACGRRCWLTVNGTAAPWLENEPIEELSAVNKEQPIRCC